MLPYGFIICNIIVLLLQFPLNVLSLSSFHLSSIASSNTHLHNPVELPRHFGTKHSESFAPPQLKTETKNDSAASVVIPISVGSDQKTSVKSSVLILPALPLLKLSASDNNNTPKSSNNDNEPPAISLPPVKLSASNNNIPTKLSIVTPVQSNPSTNVPPFSLPPLYASSNGKQPIKLSASYNDHTSKSSNLDNNPPEVSNALENVIHAPPLLKLSENTPPQSKPSIPNSSEAEVPPNNNDNQPSLPKPSINVRQWTNDPHRLSLPTELPRYFNNSAKVNSQENSANENKYLPPAKPSTNGSSMNEKHLSESVKKSDSKPGIPTVKTGSLQLSSLKSLSEPSSIPPNPEPIVPKLSSAAAQHSSAQKAVQSRSYKWPNGDVHRLSIPTELPRYFKGSDVEHSEQKSSNERKFVPQTTPSVSVKKPNSRPGIPTAKADSSQLSSLKSLSEPPTNSNDREKELSMPPNPPPVESKQRSSAVQRSSVQEVVSSHSHKWPNGNVHRLSIPTELPRYSKGSAVENSEPKSRNEHIFVPHIKFSAKVSSIKSKHLSIPNLPPRPGGAAVKSESQLSSLKSLSVPPVLSVVNVNAENSNKSKKQLSLPPNTTPVVSQHNSSAKSKLPPPALHSSVKSHYSSVQEIVQPHSVHWSNGHVRRLSLPTELPRYPQASIKGTKYSTNNSVQKNDFPSRPGGPAVKTGSQQLSLPPNPTPVVSKKDNSQKSKPSINTVKSLPTPVSLPSVSPKENSPTTSNKQTTPATTVQSKSSNQKHTPPHQSDKSITAKLKPLKLKSISLRMPNLLTLDSYPPAKSMYVKDTKPRSTKKPFVSMPSDETNAKPAFLAPAIPVPEKMHTPTVLSYFPPSPQFPSPPIPKYLQKSQSFNPLSLPSISNRKAISDMSKLMWSNETSFQLPSLLSFLNSNSNDDGAAVRDGPFVGAPEASFKSIPSIPDIQSIPSQSSGCVQCPPTAAGFAPFCAMPKTASFSHNSVLKFPNKCLFNLYNCKNPDKQYTKVETCNLSASMSKTMSMRPF